MKKTEGNLILLNVIFAISIVIANVVGCKVFNTGFYIGKIELATSGAFITYGFSFLCTDIISQIWGKGEAQRAVWRGFYGQLLALAFIVLTQYLPTKNEAMQNAYETLLGQTPFFVLGSLVAYLISQTWDVHIFHKIREKFENKTSKKWIWNNVSTITSQAFDTLIYCTISFGFGLKMFWWEYGWNIFIGLLVGQYLLKVCVALLDTPLFYIFTREK